MYVRVDENTDILWYLLRHYTPSYDGGVVGVVLGAVVVCLLVRREFLVDCFVRGHLNDVVWIEDGVSLLRCRAVANAGGVVGVRK